MQLTIRPATSETMAEYLQRGDVTLHDLQLTIDIALHRS